MKCLCRGRTDDYRKRKISYDPNNTNWSRSESKYGQRILQAQGWKPGDYLGAKDASHAKYHTAASLSHIKVVLREDNLGLGARVGAAGGEWETTGLGGFQDLLGRLNGQTEAELGKAQRMRDDMKRRLYSEQRWGTLRFVSGGLLVGDKLELAQKVEETQSSRSVKIDPGTDRLASLTDEGGSQDVKNPARHPKKKSKKLKDKKAPNPATPLEHVPLVKDLAASETVPIARAVSEAQRKSDKTERKLQRRLKKEARLESKIRSPANNAISSLSTPAPSTDCEFVRKAATSSHPNNGIQAVRHRHIKHKKMAMMDSKALNEVGLSYGLIWVLTNCKIDPHDKSVICYE